MNGHVTTLGLATKLARKLPPTRTKVRMGRALTAVVTRLGGQPIITSTMNDGTVLRLDSRSRDQAGPFWNGSFDPVTQNTLRALTRRFGGSVYDIGANVGMVAVPLARHIKGYGTVACFEPVSRNANQLVRNIELNGLTNCSVYEVALGAENGEAQILREAAHGASTGNAILASGGVATRAGVEVSTIQLVPLDDLVSTSGLKPPDVIKLDVEGSEVNFLRGARSTLRDFRPIILGEFNNLLMPNFGTTFLDAVALLPDDYLVFGFVAADVIVEKAPDVGVGDVLLVPSEKVAQLPIKRIPRDR